MAAYAAVVSLMNTIHNIQNHSRLSASLDHSQMESLGGKLDFLLSFVENHHSYGGHREAEVLESQIASVAHAAEDVIESHIVDRIEPLMARSTTSDHEEKSWRLLLDFLLNMMQLIENSPSLLTSPDGKQIESLGEKLDFLLDFVENHLSPSKEAEFLESKIASEAHAIKDAIKTQIDDRFKSHVAELNSDDIEIKSSIWFDLLVFYMEQILNHPPLWTSLDSGEVDFIRNVVDFLQCFTDTTCNSERTISEEECVIESDFDLQKGIKAMKEKVIMVHKRMHGKKAEFVGPENSFLPDLQKILEDMDSVKEKAMKFKEERGFKDLQVPSSKPLTIGKEKVVGFHGYVVQLLDWLTAEQSDLQIVSITGMGGIGKTTLARSVYEDLRVVQHFDVCAWLTLSQEYNVRELLFQTLSSLVKSPNELLNKTENELGVLLHKILYGRRYLIILDDMWSIEAWDEISLYFPREEERSRIVVTSRESGVASHFASLRLALNFLDDDNGWDLFCEKAFEQGCCPSELENIGRKIVKKCKGLPLSIVVIGGLLGKSSRMKEHWENVEKDLSSILNTTGGNQCFDILSLGYSHLPAHLKPCFLYLGIFPEDREISVSRLTKLWVAEGFLKPNKEPCLEKVAKDYMEDLVGRNLLIVHSLSLKGKVKTCRIHDLLRDFCIKVAKNEKFFCFVMDLGSPRDIGGERRLITLESTEEERRPQLFRTLQSASFVRSIVSEAPCLLSPTSRLLRVLCNAYDGFPDTAFQLVNLRFLECHSKSVGTYSYELPLSISLLWNLQTLIIEGFYGGVVAPSEIWDMQQLRHLQISQVNLPEPPPQSERQDRIVLRNLQTLRVAYIYKWSSEVCKRMPNIKKLRITFVNYLEGLVNPMANSCFYNVGCLNKLETFYFDSVDVDGPTGLLQNLKLPDSLKKLCLCSCRLTWDDLTVIGSLPHLEVLKLNWNSVQGPEWRPIEGEFRHLKYLQICQCYDLIYWDADSCHFPVLEKLVIEELWELDEIPSGIGDIPTLVDIYLDSCSVSAVISAVSLLREQESLGNEGLRVRVKFWNEKQREEAREKVELEGFTSLNFQLS